MVQFSAVYMDDQKPGAGLPVVLPLPPRAGPAYGSDMDLYTRFMRSLRSVRHGRMEIRILSAIQFTADMLNHSDAHVAKALVDLGLRAPCLAFPADFLRFAEASFRRSGFEIGAPSAAMLDLKRYWEQSKLQGQHL